MKSDYFYFTTIILLLATVEPGKRVATLTTPLIEAPPPRTFDCISFEYFFFNGGEASLTVSLVDTHGVALALWSVSHNNDSKTGKFIPEKGQLSVASGAAFRVCILYFVCYQYTK